tara:strand:+ start:847 stop:2349 length:1503 start_codon:yes stop_codon:yes gene_type:complete
LSKKIFFKKLIILLIFFHQVAFLYAFPEYTSREKALKLAAVIDHGFFKSIKISSVFVKNRDKDEYYLQAILEDGSSRKWLINRIREWTHTDELILNKNRALVFPYAGRTDFGVLEKNDFYRRVLSAKAFIKIFGKHDILEGKSIVLGIRRFRILQPKDSKFLSTNKLGERFRYLLELENGSKEFFTYSDAFTLLKQGAFLEEIPEKIDVFNKTFKIQGLKKIPIQIEDELREIWRFGIEVFFDRKIPKSFDNFPYQVVENKFKDPVTGSMKAIFFLQIILPNSEKIKEIDGFKNHEYLRYVGIDTHVEHQKRVILRAMVNPDALSLPPFVEVTNRNSIIVNFYTSTDQSLTQPPDLLSSRSNGDLPRSVFISDNQETEFEKNYMEAVRLIREAQAQLNTNLRIEFYFKALKALKKAAISAELDIQIAQAFNQRDLLLGAMPKLIIRNVQMSILALELEGKGLKFEPEISEKLLDQLIYAERYAKNQDQLEKIIFLKNQIR